MNSKITSKDIILADKAVQERRDEFARKHLLAFTRSTMPTFQDTDFHKIYYKILSMFADRKIKRLMVTMGPQHGKSEGSTRRLPAYCLGVNPNTKIAIASYNTSFARKFNRDVQRIIDTPEYYRIFPNTTLNSSNVVTVSSNFLRNSDEFEIVNHRGGLKAVGRGGPLTGNPVDVMIMDDLYKDYAEGNSPIIRDSVWDWYTTVVRTRLHNDSQELIVFTRWHEDDLIGRISQTSRVITLDSIDDIDPNLPSDTWYKINFEAIKTGEPTELDPRKEGMPLYPEKHNIEKLNIDRKIDTIKFEALYQGNPTSKEGLLYGTFKTYRDKPNSVLIRRNYTDTADMGNDKLCSISYDKTKDNTIYVVDIIYTDAPMEITEPLVSKMLNDTNTRESDIESNNGGRGFARKVDNLTTKRCNISWFHQSDNKEARIISNAASVTQMIIFPEGWQIRWPEFYRDVVMYKRLFKANRFDDGPDVLTGIVEKTLNKQKIVVF